MSRCGRPKLAGGGQGGGRPKLAGEWPKLVDGGGGPRLAGGGGGGGQG